MKNKIPHKPNGSTRKSVPSLFRLFAPNYFNIIRNCIKLNLQKTQSSSVFRYFFISLRSFIDFWDSIYRAGGHLLPSKNFNPVWLLNFQLVIFQFDNGCFSHRQSTQVTFEIGWFWYPSSTMLSPRAFHLKIFSWQSEEEWHEQTLVVHLPLPHLPSDVLHLPCRCTSPHHVPLELEDAGLGRVWRSSLHELHRGFSINYYALKICSQSSAR